MAGLLLGAGALTGCTSSSPPPQGQEPPAPQATLTVSPVDITPAQRALAHVPGDVTAVTITDFDRAALQLGLEELSSDLPGRERNAFWNRAQRETAILSDGLLRPFGPQLLRDHSFSQEDVGWEARPAGPFPAAVPGNRGQRSAGVANGVLRAARICVSDGSS